MSGYGLWALSPSLGLAWFNDLSRCYSSHDCLSVESQLTIMALPHVLWSELPHSILQVVIREQANVPKNATCYKGWSSKIFEFQKSKTDCDSLQRRLWQLTNFVKIFPETGSKVQILHNFGSKWPKIRLKHSFVWQINPSSAPRHLFIHFAWHSTLTYG